MTAADASTPEVSVRGNIVIGAASIVVGAAVIPYGAGMPYIREGIPGPGLFPMMIGGLLILFGLLIIVTAVLSSRRDRLHAEQMAVAEAEAPPAGVSAPHRDAESGATAEAVAPAADGPAGVPADSDDIGEEGMRTQAVMDTDIGSDGIRRWINGAILMGGIVFYVLFAEIIGFPLTMTILVTAIVWSLRAKWWVAVLTGVLTALGLWLMFEQGLLVQLPDGPFRGF